MNSRDRTNTALAHSEIMQLCETEIGAQCLLELSVFLARDCTLALEQVNHDALVQLLRRTLETPTIRNSMAGAISTTPFPLMHRNEARELAAFLADRHRGHRKIAPADAPTNR